MSFFTIYAAVAGGLILVILILGLVALIRCDRADIPDVVRGIGTWFSRARGPKPPSLPRGS